MQRVVPSQVMQFIDRMFPGMKDQLDDQHHTITLAHENCLKLSALLSLVDSIPPELLVLEGDDYVSYIASVSIIRSAIEGWTYRGADRYSNVERIPGVSYLNPVTILRRKLDLCPDEAPSSTTHDLSFIGDPDLRQSIRLDISTASQTFVNGEWKATTVLAGAATEALLLSYLTDNSTEPKRERAIEELLSSGNFSSKEKLPADLNKWNLSQLIQVAWKLEIIREATRSQCLLAKDFRNFIHPGREVRLDQRCNRATALTALAAVEHIIADLQSRT